MASIGEVSKRSGVNIETIRYYERMGLLPPPDRTRSGRRTYDAAGLSRVAFIKRCRELGFSLADTGALLKLATKGGMNCGEAKHLAESHLDAIARKMQELARLRRALTGLVDQCGDAQSECPILKELLDEVDAPTKKAGRT